MLSVLDTAFVGVAAALCWK